MRIRYFTALLFVVFIISLTGEPQRERGLSVHMLPDRVAQINGRSGGFTVRGVNEIESTYPDARQLLLNFAEKRRFRYLHVEVRSFLMVGNARMFQPVGTIFRLRISTSEEMFT